MRKERESWQQTKSATQALPLEQKEVLVGTKNILILHKFDAVQDVAHIVIIFVISFVVSFALISSVRIFLVPCEP